MRILLFGIILLLFLSYRKYKKIEKFDDIKCSCKNGIPVESTNCSKDNKELCESCNGGYKLNNKLCISKCICNNGIPHEGKECEENIKLCIDCDKGYYLNNKKCIKEDNDDWIDSDKRSCEDYINCNYDDNNCCDLSYIKFKLQLDDGYKGNNNKYAFDECKNTCNNVNKEYLDKLININKSNSNKELKILYKYKRLYLLNDDILKQSIRGFPQYYNKIKYLYKTNKLDKMILNNNFSELNDFINLNDNRFIIEIWKSDKDKDNDLSKKKLVNKKMFDFIFYIISLIFDNFLDKNPHITNKILENYKNKRILVMQNNNDYSLLIKYIKEHAYTILNDFYANKIEDEKDNINRLAKDLIFYIIHKNK
jgi:hypothetical protein